MLSHKKRQFCSEARFHPSAELFDELNVLNVYDYYFLELRFLNQFVVLWQLNISGRYVNANFLLLKPEKLTLIFSAKESCCSCLRYRGAKLVYCLGETGSGTADYSKRIKRKQVKHMQHVIVKDHFANIFIQ